MKKIFSLMLATFIWMSVLSQENRSISIGETVPDIKFENILNYKSKTAHLSDFKGKLVILDMWSVWCTSCIAAFPKMEKLQNEFKGKIQILLVNPHDAKHDSEVSIRSTLDRNKIRTGFYPTLPIPIHDSILNNYFPHKSVPHLVWIAGNVVVAITDAKGVTSENIRSILEGKKINIPVKDDWAFDRESPLLVGGNGGEAGDFIYRSLFTGFKKELRISRGLRVNKNEEVVGIYMLNKSLRKFIHESYEGIMNGVSSSRIILDVKNPAQFQWEINPSNTYCYDLTIPPTSRRILDINKYLREDLNRYFNISVHKEKRKLPCLVLTTSDEIEGSFTKYDKKKADLNNTSIRKYIHNYPVDKIVTMLEGRFNRPLIDETSIANHIDIDFPDNFDLSDSNAIIRVLKKIGFNIKEEVRELEVVVISDTK